MKVERVCMEATLEPGFTEGRVKDLRNATSQETWLLGEVPARCERTFL